MDPEFVDRIYESAFVPELWPGVLDELAQIAEASGGALWITHNNVKYWTASSSLQERAKQFVEGNFFQRGTSFSRLFGARHAGFLTESDLFTPAELDLEPLYRDLWRPRGIGWAVATAIPMPTGENVTFVFPRRTERGPVERNIVHKLDGLRPHLARTALMSARFQLERAARVASETLAALGLPALILNEQGRVLAANSLIEALTGYVRWRAQDRVSLKDRAADQLLRDAIEAIDVPGGPGVRSFPVRDTGAEAMMVAHVVPIRLSARDIFVRCVAAFVLTPVALPQAPPVELVQSLFDLTPTEARVARSLASGKTVEDIARDGGTSANTIRTHVRGVLEKTGCNRQVDIVALLTAISVMRLTHPV
jgi:DNA-binding CsgD family transcriptional regulator